MDPDNAPELTTRKPRTTGKLVWLRVCDEPDITGFACFRGIDRQPEHADIAAASKWLAAEVADGRLDPAPSTYALHRAICTVSPRVEVTRKAVL